MALSDKRTFSVHIAIDFGTDGVGLAYAFKGDVYIHNKWNSVRYGSMVKPKTIILLDENGNTKAFGLDAKTTYMSISSSKRNKWMLFDRFKMSLYDKDENDNDTKIDIIDELTATNGKQYPSEKVFIAAFQYLHNETQIWLKKKQIKLKDEEIGWIITVPAIWNDASKNKMKEWTIKAGLVDTNIPNQCRIVYEPDCASLAIQNHINHSKFSTKQYRQNNNYEIKQPFVNDDNYVLVDAGGGTVDIACHKMLGDFQIKEILKPSGGKWGSCYIDDQYVQLLYLLFGKVWLDEFNEAQPNDFVQIIHNFQQSKSTFYRNPHTTSHNVELPTDFCGFLEDKLDESEGKEFDDIEDMVDNTEIFGKSGLVTLVDDTLEIGVKAWQSMFDYVIDPIINHIKKLLREQKLRINCKYLCLVGGLSCSPYFQYKMENAFGMGSEYKLKLMIPCNPILSVVEGAAYFGIKDDYIKSRVLRKTYGIKRNIMLNDAYKLGISRHFIERNRFWNKYTKKNMVHNYFDVLARKNQEICSNEIITKRFKRQSPDQPRVCMGVTCTDLIYPKTATSTMDLGKLYLYFDENDNSMDIMVEFHFYDTTLKIYTYSTNQPQKKKQISVEFEM